jgi:CRISPR type IV-associated DEAD/DEAH-box helicase Csf4
MLRVADQMRAGSYLPTDGETLGQAIKVRLAKILADEKTQPLSLQPLPRPSVNLTVWLSAQQLAVVQRLGEPAGLTAGETATALLIRDFDEWAQALREPEKTSAAPAAALGSLGRVLGSGVRPEQVRMLKALHALDAQDGDSRTPRVLFCEAGTGTGKTLAYLGYALDELAAHPTRRVMIAAPSFALFQQIGNELARFGAEAPQAVYLAGQSEWVSETALKALIDEAQEIDGAVATALRNWLRTGGDGSRPRWSMGSLLQDVAGFNLSDDVTVAQRSDDEDAGWKAYQKQFVDAAQARLVVLSHAMLAHLVKYRLMLQLRASRGAESLAEAARDWMAMPPEERGERLHERLNEALACLGLEEGCDRLPDVDLLIIDEGHAIEDAFAAAFGMFASLRNVLRDARDLHAQHPGALSRTARQRLEEVVSRTQAIGAKQGSDDVIALEANQALLDELIAAIQEAVSLKKSGSRVAKTQVSRSPEYRRVAALAAALEVARQASRVGARNMGAFLHWSPVRDYPRISVGKLWLDRELHYLWTVVTQRTALVSGCLYEEMPRPSCEALRRALAVPPAAVLTMEPIHARWQLEPVTLCVVPLMQRLDGKHRFIRPKYSQGGQRSAEDMAPWVADVLGYLQQVQATSVGGILVLGTAFSDLDAVAGCLASPGEGWTVLVQRPGIKLAGLRAQFLRLSRDKKVILLATGAAWTGFDLHDPQTPDALTDLVILNAPFGVFTQSVSRLRRQSTKGGHFDVASQALVLVRQAVGRLVRSPDTPSNRRIHWLDARIHTPEMVGMMAAIRRFLARYRTVTVG